jgi:antitoxin HigA-1
MLSNTLLQMYNPPHPGVLLRELMENHNLSTYQLADILGVNRPYLSKILNQKQGISVVMALRIEKAFKGNYETWLNMQELYDVWQAKQNIDLLSKVKVFQSNLALEMM